MNDYFEIDKITCNDVDIEKLFSLTNNTQSAIGREFLYDNIKYLQLDKCVLEKRKHIFTTLKNDAVLKTELDKSLNILGDKCDISLYEYIDRLDSIQKKNTIFNKLLALLLIISFSLIFITKQKSFLVIFFLMCAVNMIIYFIDKSKIAKNLKLFAYLVGFLNNSSRICRIDNNVLDNNIKKVRITSDKLKSAKRFSFCLLAGRSGTGSFIDVFLDYFRMLLHIDIIKFYSMLELLQNNKELIIEAFDAIGELDMMSSAVTFTKGLPYYCYPEFIESDKATIKLQEVYHPYISDFVANDVDFNRSVIITGSNATGKSTFLRSCMINIILSQTFCICTAKEYKAPIFNLYSSMSLNDSLLENESFYMAEIKSIKRMIDRDSKSLCVCFIDELLKGTNTRERVAASIEILSYLTSEGNLCFVATHDTEITDALINKFDNYHFNESFNNDRITFDYKLKKGVCTTSDAILLLKVMEFPDAITQKAIDNCR